MLRDGWVVSKQAGQTYAGFPMGSGGILHAKKVATECLMQSRIFYWVTAQLIPSVRHNSTMAKAMGLIFCCSMSLQSKSIPQYIQLCISDASIFKDNLVRVHVRMGHLYLADHRSTDRGSANHMFLRIHMLQVSSEVIHSRLIVLFASCEAFNKWIHHIGIRLRPWQDCQLKETWNQAPTRPCLLKQLL